jgi:hypothetical protein
MVFRIIEARGQAFKLQCKASGPNIGTLFFYEQETNRVFPSKSTGGIVHQRIRSQDKTPSLQRVTDKRAPAAASTSNMATSGKLTRPVSSPRIIGTLF